MTKYVPETTLLAPSQVAYTVDPSRPVLTDSRSVLAETGLKPHSHPRGQLLWAIKGVLRVTSLGAVWVVPSSHAVWIPGEIQHQVWSETETQMHNLYVDPAFRLRRNQNKVVMLKMTPFMRELVLKMIKVTEPEPLRKLGLVAIDEIESLEALEIYLPAGEDPRLNRLISFIINDPGHNSSLEDLSTRVGASVRTIERLFKSQTGMTYRKWRSRFRMMNALEQLRQLENTNLVTYELGYKSVSSFISTFRELFGYTPQEYLSREKHHK